MCGGGRPEGLDSGFFVQPTVFADVDNKMTIAQEEIFGPVLSIIPYDTEEDAIKIANDSVYGLAGSVWTTDVAEGIEVSEKIRTGTYAINWYAFDPCCPFGGYKNSGIGRENGPEGVEHFTQQKSVLMPMGYTDRELTLHAPSVHSPREIAEISRWVHARRLLLCRREPPAAIVRGHRRTKPCSANYAIDHRNRTVTCTADRTGHRRTRSPWCALT